MTALPKLDRRRAVALFGDDTGAATAEYAITTMATVAAFGRIYGEQVLPPDPTLSTVVRRQLRRWGESRPPPQPPKRSTARLSPTASLIDRPTT